MLPAPDILRWAQACRAAYNSADPAVQFTELGFEIEGHIQVGDVSAYAIGDDQVFGLVGPGTNGLRNLLRDASIRFTAFDAPRFRQSVLVHDGFLGWWQAIADWATRCQPRGRQVVFSGHSAFGAAMQIAASVLHADVLITFGSPRVGNDDFASQLMDLPMQLVRVVHHLDLVPTVPSVGYVHAGDATCLDDRGQLQPPPEDLPEHALNRAEQLFADITLRALDDHHIDGYVTACAAFAGVHVD